MNTLKLLMFVLFMGTVSPSWADTYTVEWNPQELFTADEILVDHTYRAGDVQISFSKDTGGGSSIWSSKYLVSKGYFKFYGSNYITLIVPDGKVITSVQFFETEKYNKLSLMPYTGPYYFGTFKWDSKNLIESWTGSSPVVMLTNKDQIYIQKISITYEDSTPNGESLNISDAKYCTYFNEVGYFMPAGCTGYTVTVKESGLECKAQYPSGIYVPAKTPLLIHGEGDHVLYKDTNSTGKSPTSNDLHGDLTEETHSGEGTYYQFSYGSGVYTNKLGFYWQQGSVEGKSITNGANKCYLLIPESSNIQRVSGYMVSNLPDDGETTMLRSVDADVEHEDGKAYNLNGQEVENSYRGVVVKNGVKFLNR